MSCSLFNLKDPPAMDMHVAVSQSIKTHHFHNFVHSCSLRTNQKNYQLKTGDATCEHPENTLLRGPTLTPPPSNTPFTGAGLHNGGGLNCQVQEMITWRVSNGHSSFDEDSVPRWTKTVFEPSRTVRQIEQSETSVVQPVQVGVKTTTCRRSGAPPFLSRFRRNVRFIGDDFC